MNRYYATAGMVLVGLLVLVGPVSAQSASQPAAATTAPADNEGGVGTVKGSNVYVRAGFSRNYYPVLKLNEGDKVTFLRSAFGWLEILPPAGAYSVVEKARIDKANDTTGTANDTAQVYAGSDLDKQKYAKQVKLTKGEKVRILGETAEGDFYKITPPEGATLWIRADLVNRGAKGSNIEVVKTLPDTKGPGLAEKQGDKPADKPAKKLPVAAAAKSESGLTQDHRDLIRAIDTDIAAEMLKPSADRVLEPIIGKLQPLADQTGDFVTQTWAKTRIEQLRNQSDFTKALSDMKSLKDKAIVDANEIARRRAEEKRKLGIWDVNPVVARGEIRASGLYTGTGGQAKRWRLIDTKTGSTAAYLEVAPNSSVDPVQFYGKFVGIEATSYQLQHGTVPALPIYLVKNIKVMDPNAPFDPIVHSEAIMLSPVGSQPAGEKPATSQPALQSSPKPAPDETK